MADLDAALKSQIANLPQRTGKTLDELVAIVKGSGLDKHGQIVAMLKGDHGLGHGDANLVAHMARQSDGASIAGAAATRGEDPADAWYDGPKAALRPLHDAVLAFVATLGDDVEHAPKKTYLSLRRKKQFAMVGPATRTLVEVGLNLGGAPGAGRLEALKPGGMCSHRVRIATAGELDAELQAWIRQAYEGAG